jgi:NAD(P)H dehydrogenase (quinone)
MNHLIIFAHPNPASFGSALCREFVKSSESKGNKVQVRNLYEIAFNPVLSAADLTSLENGIVPADIKAEHAYITEADHLTFIYPVWWGGMPAIMKGYIDRVFSYGFAYEYNETGVKGLLAGKRGSIICTSGASNEEYEKAGMHAAMRLVAEEVICAFCGMTFSKCLFLGNIAGVSQETRERWLKEIMNYEL